MDSSGAWLVVWLVSAVALAAAEIMAAGLFVFLPFAAGAGAAAVAALLGAPLAVQLGVFVVGSGAAFAGLWPLGRRLERRTPSNSVGAARWTGREAYVLADIPGGPGATGMVRLDREEWRAESATGVPIPAGSTVLVSRVDGTRLVVLPLELPEGAP